MATAFVLQDDTCEINQNVQNKVKQVRFVCGDAVRPSGSMRTTDIIIIIIIALLERDTPVILPLLGSLRFTNNAIHL